MLKLLLFDVDGTLITSAGAGVRAMSLALRDIYGLQDGLRDIAVAGRIDCGIFRGALAKHGLPRPSRDEEDHFRDVYLSHLAHTIVEAEGGRVFPGVRELLTTLRPRTDVRLSLATGNFRGGARLKLSRFGLWEFFDDGAFAGVCEERTELIAAAKRNLLGEGGEDSLVYVFGDTEHDIAAARANDAIAVAVATGFASEDVLRAASPDFLFQDFSDWKGVIAALGLQR